MRARRYGKGEIGKQVPPGTGTTKEAVVVAAAGVEDEAIRDVGVDGAEE